MVVDVDSEDCLNYVKNLQEKHIINSDDLKMTRSNSNTNKINKFKYHTYLKNNLNTQNNKLKSDID